MAYIIGKITGGIRKHYFIEIYKEDEKPTDMPVSIELKDKKNYEKLLKCLTELEH